MKVQKTHIRSQTHADDPACGSQGDYILLAEPGYEHRADCKRCLKMRPDVVERLQVGRIYLEHDGPVHFPLFAAWVQLPAGYRGRCVFGGSAETARKIAAEYRKYGYAVRVEVG